MTLNFVRQIITRYTALATSREDRAERVERTIDVLLRFLWHQTQREERAKGER
jgi:hypothetical protein